MAADFDPYYKWLGIPPKDQPPHYYRLLGIELFEADLEVIALAAEQRMLHVRSFQSCEYVLVSQKLQKKIAAAKACLLNPEKRAEYDISLRLQLRLQPAQSLPLPPQQNYPASPPVAPPSPLLQDYLQPPPVVQTAPAQPSNTDFNINPIVVVKESVDFLRSHKWVVSVSIKLACAAVVVVIMLMVFAHGKALWTFTFDKTSNLVAKINGSSAEKPPERLTRTRTIPGVKPENPASIAENQPSGIPPPPVGIEEKSVVGENSSAANTVTPPPAAENNQASPPTAEITSLKLPSGKNFKSRLFKVNLNLIIDLLKDPAKDEPVLCMFYPTGEISTLASHEKGVLNGISISFFENCQPLIYATYEEGLLDGIVKTWDVKGERVYWCQYTKGVRDGFCCYFQNNCMHLLLEIDQDKIVGVHLCGGGELKKSFSSVEQAADDKDAQALLDAVDELEAEFKTNEGVFKKQVKDELQRLRREKLSASSPLKRAALQDRINLRVTKGTELIRTLHNFNGM